jgi:hypothetical protein
VAWALISASPDCAIAAVRELIVLAGASHWLPAERPSQVIPQLLKQLDAT